MIREETTRCPYCGELVDVDVDVSGGRRQQYVEDCPVCCRPWEVEVVAIQEDVWHVTLRTADE